MIYIYAAARWSRQIELRAIRDMLKTINPEIKITSTWLDNARPEQPNGNFFLSDEGMQRMRQDLSDIEDSDMIVADMTDGFGRRGGMMIEIGYGLGLGKNIVLIGDPVRFGVFGNLFLKSFPDWETAIPQYFKKLR